MASANLTSTLTPELQTFYDKVFFERLQAETAYDFLTTKKSIPKNSGKVVYLTRQTAFTPSTGALTEGVTPAISAFTAATISATIAQYGAYSTFSELFEMTTIDTGLKEKVDTFGQFAAEKMDKDRLYTMVAGATTQYANQKASLSTTLTTDTLDVADLRYAVLTLKNNKAPKFSAPVGSLNKGGAYRGVISSKGYYDLLGDSSTGAFTSINLAVSSSETGQIKDQAIKRIAGIDLIESNAAYSEVSAGAGAAAEVAYSNLITGKDAVLEVDIAGGGNPHIIYKKPGAGDTSEPLNLNSSLAWKVDSWACVVADANWIINIKAQ